MGYKASFQDNQVISADQLNAIITELGTGASVSDAFVDGQTYHTDDLNRIRQDLVTAGVLSGMACNVSGNTVKISTGTAVFETGLLLEIDAEGVSLSIPDGGTGYVYLYRSELQQTALPVITSEEKENVEGQQEYIPLCTVAGGVLTDMRKWSNAKITLLAGNNEWTYSGTAPAKEMNLSSSPNREGVYYEIDMPNDSYNFAYIQFYNASTNQFMGECMGLLDQRLRGNMQYATGLTGNTDEYIYHQQYSIYLKKTGAKLQLIAKQPSNITQISVMSYRVEAALR